MIRRARDDDNEAIRALMLSAFDEAAEADLVEALREEHDLVLTLVDEGEDGLRGVVVFSAMRAPDGAVALAPMAVAKGFRKQGVGSALIGEGLKQLREAGWISVFVLGPPTYYDRFGFNLEAAQGYASPYAGRYFMALELQEGKMEPVGEARHAPAFASFE